MTMIPDQQRRADRLRFIRLLGAVALSIPGLLLLYTPNAMPGFILGAMLTLLGFSFAVWSGLTQTGQPSMARMTFGVVLALLTSGYMTWQAYDVRQEQCMHTLDAC